jgi:GLPGLI family protein
MKISKTMKRILLIVGLLVSLAAVQVVLAQSSEGVIDYEVKANLHRNLPKDREGMKSMIPEFRTTKQQLFFNAEESIYKPVIEDDDDGNFESAGGGVRMRMQQPQVEIYSNQTTSQRLVQQEFMGKTYLIQDTLKVSPWKFGSETKIIMGHECKQASFYNEERKQNITAWYTSALRPFLGPENFNSLPGAVLEININDGERVITAKKLEPRSLKKNELKVPTQGIKTTQKEFRKMTDEQIERMRANGANVFIRN